MFIWLILILEFVADYLISRDLKTPATHQETKSRNNSCQRRSDTSSQRIRHVFKNSIAYHSRKAYRVYKIWGKSLKFLQTSISKIDGPDGFVRSRECQLSEIRYLSIRLPTYTIGRKQLMNCNDWVKSEFPVNGIRR